MKTLRPSFYQTMINSMYHMSGKMGQNTTNLLSIRLMQHSSTNDMYPCTMVLTYVFYHFLDLWYLILTRIEINQEGFPIFRFSLPIHILLDLNKDIWMDLNQVYNQIWIGWNDPKRNHVSQIVPKCSCYFQSSKKDWVFC